MGWPSQRRTVGTLALVQVVGGIGNGAGLAVGGLLIEDVTGSAGWAGMAVVATTLGAALFTVPLSNFAVHRGRRPALTAGWWGGSLGAVAVVGGAAWESLPLLLLGFLLFGASTAANLQSRFAAADRAEPAEVGRSIALVVWATTIGSVAGPNLTGPGATVARALGIPELAGPQVFSGVAFAAAGLLTWLMLRPDPLERRSASAPAPPRIAAALPHVRGATAVAITAVALSHAIMVSVMALTPVHMSGHGAELSVIGLTISLHIAGMFALSPLFGWTTDRWGAVPTIVAGQIVLVLACAIAGTAGHSNVQITAGLILLGVGWSMSVIAGAALLTRSVDPAVRPLVQGFSDLTMNLAGAAGGLLAGLVVAVWNYGTLTGVAGVLTLPVIAAIVLASQRKREHLT
ncbi:MFS transporter [Aeromicrobium duanguangcaii]|uniref:MFS transporter n=1 Tax=Aeromicrobium duanguangcaii TaxID=2968086 RepID=A0ABY5KHU5_9ACTN|nr:MFS transporter [Aeromicrobium duanguangcaii]MCD9153545.1 MFS transporter [Aeromicrobium duanguangcaii]MCL3836470.1 MFS transporter [Aeromicrobium duanguangcaii]UUI69369.1 MFS transporter [Aeromicrobium duanguangcaii]